MANPSENPTLWWITCRALCLCMLLASSLVQAETPAPRPKYGPQVIRLNDDHAYLQKAPAVDYWRLAPYYLGQRDDRSCSLACVTMVVNFARAERKLLADEPLAMQEELFELVDDATWRAGLAEGGEGLTLDQLAEIVEQALKKYRIHGAKVQAVHLPSASRQELQKLHELLATNEKSADDLLLVNVLQSELTGDPEGAVGHFIPVAAYDAKADRVLLMDPDRQWYEPYWVSTDILLRAMATKDADSGQPRGYLFVQFSAKK